MPQNIDLELIHLSWLAGEEETRQKNVLLARDYYDGDQHVKLTDRQKEYLGFRDSGRFCVNYCSSVVDAVVERLAVAGFQSVDSARSAWAWTVWQANRMDARQKTVHLSSVRDGEAFVFVDWDEERQQVRFTPHPRYTAPHLGGNGFGCKVFFQDDDPEGVPLYATKRWTATLTNERGKRETRQRMNVYYPERIERYIMGGDSEATWMEYHEADEPWPQPWTGLGGEPLGIPIVAFANPGLRTELWDAIPIQDAINKSALDILASADAAGFPLRVTAGFHFTTDGQPPTGDNYLEFTPGAFLYIPEGMRIQELTIPELSPLLETFDNWVVRLAQVTDTPLSRFQITRQVAAEGTLKQQESPLLAKVDDRQIRLGNSWEDCYTVAAALQTAFGPTDQRISGEELLSTLWRPAAVRDSKEVIEEIALKVETLHIPLDQAWREAGYSQEEIDEMQASPEYQARLAMMNLSTTFGGSANG